jgi:hypothetical protein
MILTAIAPFSFAALVEHFGVHLTLGLLAGFMSLSIVLLVLIAYASEKSV